MDLEVGRVYELPGQVTSKTQLLMNLYNHVEFADYEAAERLVKLLNRIFRFEEYPPYYAHEVEILGYIVDRDYEKAIAVALIHRNKLELIEVP